MKEYRTLLRVQFNGSIPLSIKRWAKEYMDKLKFQHVMAIDF